MTKTFNLRRSKELARAIGAEKRQCWRNSYLALMVAVPDNARVVYVEGWLSVLPGFAIEHGWLETDRSIIDVTLLGEYGPEHYFAGVRYTRREIDKACGRRSYISLPLVHGTKRRKTFGYDNEAYMLACRDANEHGLPAKFIKKMRRMIETWQKKQSSRLPKD